MKSTPPTVTAGESSQWLTYKEILVKLSIARSTLDTSRAEGKAPLFVKLPNGELRLRRSDFDAWVNQLQKVA